MAKFALVTGRRVTYDRGTRTVTLTLVTDSGRVIEQVRDRKVGEFIEERSTNNGDAE